jgi:hypothetical protein
MKHSVSTLLVILSCVACSAPAEQAPPVPGGSDAGNAGAPATAGGVGGGSAGQVGAGSGGTLVSAGSGGGAGIPAGAGTGGSGGVPPSSGSHEKILTLDTTATGANVTNDVANYALAVLLDATNFDFTQAQPGGQDVRFTAAGGTPLLHAIELWDAAAQRAAIWVKLDLVEGNDNTQSITMKWGDPSAQDASDSKAVFNQTDGYLGVFHLNQDGGTEALAFEDSSWNEVHGTGVLLQTGSLVDGRVGKAVSFANPNGGAGGPRWIKVDGEKVTSGFNPSNSQPISATVWSSAKSFNGYYETLISKGDRAWTLQNDWDNRIETCMRVDGYHSCVIDKSAPVDTWFHYMIVVEMTKLTLYINGVPIGSPAGGTNVLGDHAFGIGNQSQYPSAERGWDGVIDEVRVMAGVKTADWAKLDYESQRDDQTLIVYGP